MPALARASQAESFSEDPEYICCDCHDDDDMRQPDKDTGRTSVPVSDVGTDEDTGRARIPVFGSAHIGHV